MVIHSLLPDTLENPKGGLGEQYRNILESFPSSHQFYVIGSNRQNYTEKENYKYRPIKRTPLPIAKADPLSKILMDQSSYLRESLNAPIEPDVIHASDWSTFGAAIHASHHYNCPLVVTINLSVENMAKDSVESIPESQKSLLRINSALEMSGLLRADKIIQVSESYAENFPSILKGKTEIIGNGIDLEKYKDYESTKLPGKRDNKLVYIGRFAYMKNIQSLIQADIPENTDLIFIGGHRGGNEELLNAIKERKNKDDQVHYIGPKYGQEKIDILCSSDGMILPSKHEPFGIVALEALASKSVLISSFEGGMGDFLDEDFALNCGTDIEGIECAIRQFSEMDDSEKKSRTEKGYNEAKKHSWDNIASQVESVYSSLV